MGRLSRFGRDWNKFGRHNPYGAILTGTAGDLPQWSEDEFFATGRLDAARFMAELALISPAVPRRRALDFGCGVGRVTRALASHFESVVGVDVASTMIARARRLNRSCSNCRFVVARRPRLRVFKTGTFDVIYSRLVLQHIPQALVRRYIPELVRVLSPGGLLMFQIPGEISQEPEELFLEAPVVGGRLKSQLPRPLVRAYRRIKYRFLVDESVPTMAMFGMARDRVEGLLAEAGGRVLAIQPDQSHGPTVPGFEYWVTK